MKWPNIGLAKVVPIRKLRIIVEGQPGNRILTLCPLAPPTRPKLLLAGMS